VQQELATAEQSYKNLSYTTSQLSLLNQEVETLHKEKKTLLDIQAEFKHQLTQTRQATQTMKKKQEKLHNEAVKIYKATQKQDADRSLMQKELTSLQTDLRELELDVTDAQAEAQRLRGVLGEEVKAVQRLEKVTAKMKKETQMQNKVRESLRTEAKMTAKQTEQMEAKIQRLSDTNKQFMRRINSTVFQDTS
jgi:uncharacterized coiled-coil DUF342 family protein